MVCTGSILSADAYSTVVIVKAKAKPVGLWKISDKDPLTHRATDPFV